MKLTDLSRNAYAKNTLPADSNDQTNPAVKVLNDQIKQEQKKISVPVFEKISLARPVEKTEQKTSEPPVKEPVQHHAPVYQPESQVSAQQIQEKALSQGGLIKVPVQPQSKDGKDSVYRRVAKFLFLIGVDEAAKILPHLTPEQTEKIIPELVTLNKVDESEAAVILEEFKSLISKSRETGGVNTARNILEKAFGKDKAGELLDKAVPFKNGKPFEYLMEADSEKITALLKGESAAVRALVCSHLAPKVAAGFIQNLEEAEKKEVILRLAKLKEMSPEIVARVDAAMQKKFNSLVTQKTDTIDGRNVLANILKRMDSSSEEKIISQLSENDPDLGSDLRERLFTLEDIVNADDRFIQNKLQQMEDEDIAYLIAGKTESFRNKILSNVSTNRKNMILDEEERRIPMRRADVEKVTSRFFSYVRRAWEDGKLIIKGRDDEVYV